MYLSTYTITVDDSLDSSAQEKALAKDTLRVTKSGKVNILPYL